MPEEVVNPDTISALKRHFDRQWFWQSIEGNTSIAHQWDWCRWAERVARMWWAEEPVTVPATLQLHYKSRCICYNSLSHELEYLLNEQYMIWTINNNILTHEYSKWLVPCSVPRKPWSQCIQRGKANGTQGKGNAIEYHVLIFVTTHLFYVIFKAHAAQFAEPKPE